MGFNIPAAGVVTGRITNPRLPLYRCVFDHLLYRGPFPQTSVWQHYDVINTAAAIKNRMEKWNKTNDIYRNVTVDGITMTAEDAQSKLLIMGIV